MNLLIKDFPEHVHFVAKARAAMLQMPLKSYIAKAVEEFNEKNAPRVEEIGRLLEELGKAKKEGDQHKAKQTRRKLRNLEYYLSKEKES